MDTPSQIPRAQLRTTLEEAFEDVAMLQAGYLRQVALAQQTQKSLQGLWETFELGDLPEYEPQIRVRKVS